MARYSATPTSVSVPPIESRPASPRSVKIGKYRVVPLPKYELEPSRRAVMEKRKPTVRGEVITGAPKDEAINWWGRTSYLSDGQDREGVSELTRVLLFFSDQYGVIDARRAAHREMIDRYLALETREDIRKTKRWQAYRAGRVFYPHEFPPAELEGVSAPRPQRTPAAGPDEADRLIRLAPGLTPKWNRILKLIVDLARGCGARSSEILRIRRDDIEVAEVGGRELVTVRLGVPGGPPRVVPVFDDERGARLLEAAALHPWEYLLSVDDDPPERNAVNGINSKLRDRGFTARVDVEALRNLWVSEASRTWEVGKYAYATGTDRIDGLEEVGIDKNTVFSLEDLVTGTNENP